MVKAESVNLPNDLANVRDTLWSVLAFGLLIVICGCSPSANRSSPAADGTATDDQKSAASQAHENTAIKSVSIQAHLATDFDESREADRATVFQPEVDGWHTESFSNATSQQLEHLAKLIADAGSIDTERLRAKLKDLVLPNFRGTELRPSSLDDAFRDVTLIVRRPAARSPGVESVNGLGELVSSLQALARDLKDAEDVHVKFKVFRVHLSDATADTTVLYQASGRSPQGTIQQNAEWQVSWSPGNKAGTPKIVRINLTDYEEVVGQHEQQALFADNTRAVIGSESAYRDQLRHGIDYWRDRIPQYLGIYYFGHHGLAIGDVDGDGLDDVYVCQPGGLPNRLFLHRATGEAVEVSAAAGVNVLNNSRSALLVDLDNDGDNDLIVTTTEQVLIYDNQGAARFRLAAQLSSISGGYSTSVVDYDLDGLLDIYICVYLRQAANEDRLPYPIPYHDANNGGENALLRNVGNWKFENVTQQVGLDQHNSRFSYAGTWDDYDRDGDMDLYVANDFGRNSLYRNDDGRFSDVASDTGLEDTGFGMSATWGDFNRDGHMDLYVGNMFSSAGNRIAFQSRFQKNASPETRRKLQRSARGNSLYQNLGNGTFRDVSVDSAVTMGRWSWGTLMADLNNDGWEDIVALNGMVTGQTPDDL